MEDRSSWITELARMLLTIESPAQQAELAELAPVLHWIRAGIPMVQAAHPGEPPPAVQFWPGALARDFWSGTPGGA